MFHWSETRPKYCTMELKARCKHATKKSIFKMKYTGNKMKIILEYIEQKRKDFEKIAFFTEYFGSSNYTTEEKLAWITMKVFFTMCYCDINRFIFHTRNDSKDIMQAE